MKKSVVIYGTGKLAKRIVSFFYEIGVDVDAFCNSDAKGGFMYSKPIIRPEEIDCINSVVIIAIQNRCIAREIATKLELIGISRKAIVYGDALMRWHAPTGKECAQAGYYCTICGTRSEHYLPIRMNTDIFSHHIIGAGTREHCYCPVCGSSDRERWQKLVLDKYTNVFSGKCRVLHIAPELNIESLIRQNVFCDYYTGDIQPGKGMNIVDVTNIQFSDNFFDYVIMNHVLEHVYDEEKCLAELKRVLRNDGVLVMSFPICMDAQTDDDPSVTGEEERLQRFGQKDHVRLYGYDYKERIEKFGWDVEKISVTEYEDLGDECGLIVDDVIILARKRI